MRIKIVHVRYRAVPRLRPVPEPNRLPDMYAFRSSQIVPRPSAGANPKISVSSGADVALLGEPSLIFSPTPIRQYLPCIGDLLPAKQKAPANNPGEFLINKFYHEFSSFGNSMKRHALSSIGNSMKRHAHFQSIDNQL